ncbi:hypothetical protein D9R12_04970 [Pseudoxanthomonas spadix]|nr:hypothetical protein D9R12_04970 [Pseudoxanthomonas spadix]
MTFHGLAIEVLGLEQSRSTASTCGGASGQCWTQLLLKSMSRPIASYQAAGIAVQHQVFGRFGEQVLVLRYMRP